MNTKRVSHESHDENSTIYNRRKSLAKTPCSLFSIDQHFRRLMLYPPELRARTLGDAYKDEFIAVGRRLLENVCPQHPDDQPHGHDHHDDPPQNTAGALLPGWLVRQRMPSRRADRWRETIPRRPRPLRPRVEVGRLRSRLGWSLEERVLVRWSS
jgi:hypothetical protein